MQLRSFDRNNKNADTSLFVRKRGVLQSILKRPGIFAKTLFSYPYKDKSVSFLNASVSSPHTVDVLITSDTAGRKILASADSLIIGFSARDTSERNKLASKYNLKLRWFDYRGNFGLYRTPIGGPAATLELLRADPGIAFAELNVIDGGEDVIDDAEAAVVEIKQPPMLWNIDQVGAYKYTDNTDGRGVVVVIVDGYIDLQHPFISGKVLEYSTEAIFCNTDEFSVHGMQVASIISNNADVLFGNRTSIAPSATIIPVAISTNGTDSYPNRARALNYISEFVRRGQFRHEPSGRLIAAPRVIVNCSWKLESSVDLTSLRQAFAGLSAAGALVICSAGNGTSAGVHYPSDYPGCVAVASVDKNRWRSPTSNYGKRIDISAPGGDGVVPDEGDIFLPAPGGKYMYNFGTSFAAPHVTGAAAALWSRLPDLSAAEVRTKMLSLGVSEFPADCVDRDNLGRGTLTLQQLPPKSGRNLFLGV